MAEEGEVQEQEEGSEVEEAEQAEGEVEQEAPPETDELGEPPPAAAKGGRANEAIRQARERAQQAEARAAAAEAEAARVRAEKEARDAEAARQRELADEKDLPYEERLYRHQLRKDQEVDRKLAATEARLADQADRTAFEVKAQTNPIFKKYADRVEQELVTLRKQGNNAPREAILTFLVGKDALAPKAVAAAGKQKAAAQARVAAARGEPQPRGQAARGDAGTSRARIKSLEEKLDGVPI